MPGDYITADDGGVIVIPKDLIADILVKAQEHEVLERLVKDRLAIEDVSPGKYYPFNSATYDLQK